MATRREHLGGTAVCLMGALTGCAGVLSGDSSGPSTARDEVGDPLEEPMTFDYVSDNHHGRLFDGAGRSDPAAAILTSAGDADGLALDAPDAEYGRYVEATDFDRQFVVAAEVRRPESGWNLAVDRVIRISDEWIDVYGRSTNDFDDTDPVESFVSSLTRVTRDDHDEPAGVYVNYEFVDGETGFTNA